MTVYVDDVRFPFGRMIMCHMFADTLDELLDMADRLGLARKWLQQPPKASWVHFDVSISVKEKAIALGAVLTDKYGALEFTARQDALAGDRRGRETLARIARVRVKFAGQDPTQA